MKKCFRPRNFYRKTLDLIAECDAICTTFAEKGYVLTLRQLFYQLVVRNVIENVERVYKNLGDTISNARYAGLIDWDHIVDRVRVLNNDYHNKFENPEDLINCTAEGFSIDLWVGQPIRPEVWIEKDALIEVAANVCRPLGVPYTAVKAYGSTSAQWAGRQRFLEYIREGSRPLILHLGDHDSTGVDCSRSLQEQMTELVGQPVELRRLALNMDQIEKYDLPSNPAKDTDPRYKKYRQKFGDETWELDALAPEVIENLIDSGIRAVMDENIRDERLVRQGKYREELRLVSERWEEVQDFLLSPEADA